MVARHLTKGTGISQVRFIRLIMTCCVVCATTLAYGQGVSMGPQSGGKPTFASGINAATDVTVVQKLEKQITLSTPFVDETGKQVTLGKYFGKKPVWLVMPFYSCKNTCSLMLHGMVESLHDPALKWQVGRDFEIVVVSINPKEDSAIADTAKNRYMSELGVSGASDGWHFLTGNEPDIRRLADEIGYIYVYDAKTDQYAHPSVTAMLTATGLVSRYLFGVVYPGKDTYLALTEAGQGKIGTLADQFLLLCYHYDPARNTYGLRVIRLLQIFGTGTALLLGTFIVQSLRKERKSRLAIKADMGNKE